MLQAIRAIQKHCLAQQWHLTVIEMLQLGENQMLALVHTVQYGLKLQQLATVQIMVSKSMMLI
jgi:hypothetical protein